MIGSSLEGIAAKAGSGFSGVKSEGAEGFVAGWKLEGGEGDARLKSLLLVRLLF
jgi:hypothetical protein